MILSFTSMLAAMIPTNKIKAATAVATDIASTSDKALECCQANVHDLMVSLPTWQAVLTRTRHLNSRRN